MWNRLSSLLGRTPPPRVEAACTDLIPPDLPRILLPVAERVLARAADRTRFAQSEAQFGVSGVRDYEFNTAAREASPGAAFGRLRWGGRMVFASASPGEVRRLWEDYRGRPEWLVEREPEAIARPRGVALGRLTDLPLPPGLRRLRGADATHYFVARKVMLDPADAPTAKHSYDVRLTPPRDEAERRDATDGLVVLKRVPTLEQATARLRQTSPDTPADVVEKIAAKFVRKVFPIFLTREAAFLKLLQRDLPEAFRDKTPRLLSMEKDGDGLARSIAMKWMRQGGEPISQTDFARQSAELLRALHESVGIMHLDLRLDNLLVTERGVCLIDFGSSVRVGEDVAAPSNTNTLLREMLDASQITRDLKRLRRKQRVAAAVFDGLPFPPTPAFDLFALATNMTRPHDNAEFVGLVEHERDSGEGLRFSRLRKRILQPGSADPAPIRTVHDLCVALGVESDRPAGGGRFGGRPSVAKPDGR